MKLDAEKNDNTAGSAYTDKAGEIEFSSALSV